MSNKMSEEINEIMELAASISDFEEWLLHRDDDSESLIDKDDEISKTKTRK